MSEMVVRVARIIADNDDACGNPAAVPCVSDPPGSPDECQCMRTARAAIEALREPTAAMHDAARDWSAKKYGKPIGIDASLGCWQAMIDAALKD